MKSTHSHTKKCKKDEILTSKPNAYMSPMTIALGIIALTISKHRLLIQYADKSSPLMSCIYLTFFSLSFRMKLITAAGIRAKPIDTTNTIKMPLADAALSLSF